MSIFTNLCEASEQAEKRCAEYEMEAYGAFQAVLGAVLVDYMGIPGENFALGSPSRSDLPEGARLANNRPGWFDKEGKFHCTVVISLPNVEMPDEWTLERAGAEWLVSFAGRRPVSFIPSQPGPTQHVLAADVEAQCRKHIDGLFFSKAWQPRSR